MSGLTVLTTIEIIYGLAMLGLGILVGVLRDAIKDLFRRHHELDEKVKQVDSTLHSRISAVRENLAGNYMPRAEIAEAFSAIVNTLKRIEDKLDGKADK